MTRPRIAALACCAWIAGGAAVARAQTVPAGSARFELSGGVAWTGTTSLGDRPATLTPLSGDRFRLFTTSNELASAPGIEAGFALAVSPSLDVFAAASYGRPSLRTEVGADVEGAGEVTIEDRVQQLSIAGGIRWHLRRRIAGGAPVLEGGCGYLRELHAGDTLAVNGQTCYGGAGLDFMLNSSASRRRVGIRAEARALVRTRGVAFDNGTHVTPVAAASVFVRF